VNSAVATGLIPECDRPWSQEHGKCALAVRFRRARSKWLAAAGTAALRLMSECDRPGRRNVENARRRSGSDALEIGGLLPPGRRRSALGSLACLFLLAGPLAATAETFRLPTANQAIYENGGEERYFVGTVGKPWTTGTFGCVRSDGQQIHEGIDIRCLQRDKRGEPADPVLATADGTVAYINTRPSLSNYGNYLVLRHQIDGLEIYSLYAHLHEIRAGLQAGQTVKAGDVIALMGRTTNTREGISKDRAHVHFELDLAVNDRFVEWFKKDSPGERNDHGNFNGQNLAGIDPRLILLQQHKLGDKFSLVDYLRSEPELFRVFVRSTSFPWVRRYAALVTPNPVAEKEGAAGYEVAFDFNGVAIQLIPRAASEIKGKGKFVLLSVNEAEHQKNPARHYVVQKRGRWELAPHGLKLLELLTY
jgi:murein DD-endopeptidase MepM/ murein hydrolase activator NlpD